ncbi:hypothetical protein Tco_0199316 [Tanacetum coccineum]
MSKHEINVGFINILPEKWLSFSQGLMNANHIENQDLADIYGRFVYKDYLISRRYPESKKALITASISNSFISNNVIQDFQENSDDEEDVRSSLIAETYCWDEEEVTSDDDEMVEVKVLMALSEDEGMAVSKNHARNYE